MTMSLWMVIVLLGLLKMAIAGLMLWIPYRNEQRAMNVAGAKNEAEESGASEDDGGSTALPASPLDPHPQSPRPRPRRRGPHGTDPAPPSPPRVRTPAIAGVGSRTVPSRSRARTH
jgi:hypothetical protein